MSAQKTILGISLGTRSIGLVVLKDGVLLDWKVQCFKHTWDERKCRLIAITIARQLAQYEPHLIALKTPTQARPSTRMKMLLRAIEKLCEQRGVAVQHYSLDNLKSWLHCKSKAMLILSLLSRFPELTDCYRKETMQKSGYYIKVFEAVGAAAYCASMSENGELVSPDPQKRASVK